jgi:hypothetical protein
MHQRRFPRLGRGQWLDVEGGLFDLRNVGRFERVEVLADGRDHVLVEHRGQRHAVPKRRGYIASRFAPRLIEAVRRDESIPPGEAPG